MSDDEDDDLAARIRALDDEGRRALLGDLESIRAVLGERVPEDAAAEVDAGSIPVLREVVPSARRDTRDDLRGDARDAPQGDLFDPRAFADRLLDETWRAQREAILAEARRGAAALRASPGDHPPDEALKARLAEALGERVEQLLGEALDELQVTLGRVVRREVRRVLEEAFEADDDSTKPDGTD